MAKGNQRVNDEMVFKGREIMSLYMRILLLLAIICMTQACLPHSKAVKPRYQTTQEFLWPIDDPEISSSFGRRFMFDRHHGVDLRAPKGTPIYAAAEGTVIFAGRYSGYGKMVTIKHNDDVITKYAHNHKNIVRLGQKVASGQQIATVGSSGNASGYHLHFELIIKGRAVNPENYLH